MTDLTGAGAWDDFFADVGVDLGGRDQPAAEERQRSLGVGPLGPSELVRQLGALAASEGNSDNDLYAELR